MICAFSCLAFREEENLFRSIISVLWGSRHLPSKLCAAASYRENPGGTRWRSRRIRALRPTIPLFSLFSLLPTLFCGIPSHRSSELDHVLLVRRRCSSAHPCSPHWSIVPVLRSFSVMKLRPSLSSMNPAESVFSATAPRPLTLSHEYAYPSITPRSQCCLCGVAAHAQRRNDDTGPFSTHQATVSFNFA